MTGPHPAGDWQPHTVVTDELVDPAAVRAVATLFDDDLPVPGVGDPLPPLWHWAALPRWAASSELSVDGHPFRGSFLPPVELPRRMFAGGSVRFPGVIAVGEVVRRSSTVESVTEKHGRSGRLVVVVVSTVLSTSDGAVAVRETQNLVYREAATPTAAPVAPDEAAGLVPAGPPLVPAGRHRWDFRTDPTLLMRFSAATANAHRIHYDWPYATRVEGYPGLVVHGPLMTMALAQTHRLVADGSRIAALTHRSSKPLFCADRAQLVYTATPDGARAELLGPGGDAAGAHSVVDLSFA
ncbi:MAG: MaoC family dehydratase N-terminal domain-containing protein [Gordonia sp. (in: high G+C Gram-positive bacteria)]|uniref:FAS1-like dehydratase domain-containing protein n=1 Tax=Gordonia sp. (in: high G+C Gram-positive bacteria) TaxID=84139 RepID=UPI003C74633C